MAKKKEKSSVLPIIIVLILIIACVVGGITFYKHLTKVDEPSTQNAKAEADINNKSITIINNTNQIINDVYLYVGEGTEIAHKSTPDENNIVITIPREFEKYDSFKITLFDRYGFKYEKEIKIKKAGRTEVEITKDDYIEQDGDWWKKIQQWFNGD